MVEDASQPAMLSPMSNLTFTLPSGDKVTPKSQRRFILVESDGTILYRTDVLDRAYDRRKSVKQYILDTAGAGKIHVITVGPAPEHRRSSRWIDRQSKEYAALVAAPEAPKPVALKTYADVRAEIDPVATTIENVARRLRAGAIPAEIAAKVLRQAAAKLEEVK